MRVIFWAACGAIFYVLLGYPLLVGALARLRPRPWRTAEIAPPVSLIIAAYNEAEWIEQKLQDALRLDYPRDCLQIIVAADGSDDATVDITRRAADQGVELVYQATRMGKAVALNRAVERARGEILAFSDANALWAPDALRQLVANFADPGVAVVSGAKTIRGEHTAFGKAEALYWQYEAWIRRNENLLGQSTGVNGEILAVRRADWRPLPPETINDDFALALSAMQRGRRVIFEPRALASEASTLSAQDEVVRRRRMLAGRWQAAATMHRLLHPPRPIPAWQVLSHKVGRALVPVFALLAALANLGLVVKGARRTPLMFVERTVFAGQALVGLLVAARLAGLPMPAALGRLASVATYFVVNQYGQMLGLFSWLRGTQGPVWEKASRRPPSA